MLYDKSDRKQHHAQGVNFNQGVLNVFIDQITDPQNFGAILRSCFFLNINNIFVEYYTKCQLTPAVSKASSGALELLDMKSVKKSTEFLKKCRREGWKIISTGRETAPQ